MRRATFIRNLESFREGQKIVLFQIEPPQIMSNYGEEHNTKYIVASALHTHRPETFLFESDETGEVLSYSELEGSQRDTTDILRVMKAAGYEVLNWPE